ncbi:MAG: sugar ABC transporter permease [Candidatus Bipolaricaulota bacterium]
MKRLWPVGERRVRTAAASTRRRPAYLRARARTGVLFASPAVFLMALFLVGPILGALALSTTDFNVYAIGDWFRASFVGLQNYWALGDDPLFWTTLRNTLYFVVIAVPLSISLSLLVALLLNSPRLRLKGLFRLCYFLPVITTTAAMAVVWRWVLNYRFGMVNWLLGYVGIDGPAWLADPRWAMLAVISMVIWRGLGFNMLIFLAGLQGIPKTYYEAAKLDGAGTWALFRHITVPLLKPTTFFVTIITLIGYIQLFEEPFIMTEGGPLNATLSMAMYIYRLAFRFFHLGYASSVAYVLFAIVLIATLLRMKLGRADVEY